MTDGYYDPHPLFSIEMPISLVGHPGSGVAYIGRAISGRTGLPFNDVARSAEAIAGCSSSQMMIERGYPALLEVETQALQTAIRRKPCGVVVLESRLLEAEGQLAWLQQQSRLVYIRRPDEVLLQRINRHLAQWPGSIPDFIAAQPRDVEELRKHLAGVEALAADVEVVFDAGEEHPSLVAEKICASLNRLVQVERLEP